MAPHVTRERSEKGHEHHKEFESREKNVSFDKDYSKGALFAIVDNKYSGL